MDKTAFITRRKMYEKCTGFGPCPSDLQRRRNVSEFNGLDAYRTQPRSVPCLFGRHCHLFPHTRTTLRLIGTSPRAPQQSQFETETEQVLLDASQGKLSWTRHLR